MQIIPVPCRADNYMYILSSGTNVAVVDPYDPPKLLAAAKAADIDLSSAVLLTTHHHNDHSGGNEEFLKEFPTKAYGGSKKSPGTNVVLKHGDEVPFGPDVTIKALHTPCHTQDHICYYVESKNPPKRAVFTGDTLFVSGCGRFFEGTPEEMNHALNVVLGSLPDDTITCVGHEYTKSNVAFSASVDPSNAAIAKLKALAETEEVTTNKYTIGDEKEWNVFMRLNSAAVREKTKAAGEVSAMAALREMKNNFKG